MCERILSNNSLVWLNRHVHQAADKTACSPNLLGVDVCGHRHCCLVTLDNHGNLLKRSVASTFTDTIDSHLNLTSTVLYTTDGVGSGHAKVVVTVCRKNSTSILKTIDMLHKILDLFSIFPWHAITCSVRDVDNLGSSFNYCIYHLSKVFILSASSIFSIELHLINLVAGILYSSHSTLDNLFTCTVELIFNMRIACTDTSMDALVLGILKGFDSTINILLHGTGQSTDGRPSDSL